MPYISIKNPAIRYSLIVFLILALFLCAIFFYFYKIKSSESSLDIDKISFNIILLILIVSLIFYNLWRIYQNENNLINSSDKASQFALAKGRFLASMSHEIRTPLNSVIGFSEQLSQSKLNAEQAEQLTAILNSSFMVLDLVNDILDFSKYETTKVNFDKTSFAPFDAINEVINIIAIQAAQKDIELKIDFSFKDPVCILGDSLRLKQLVMNLLSNAIKFTERGSIRIKAEVVLTTKRQALLNVQIIDTGIGIAAIDLDMIFDEFAQINYVPAKFRRQGTGLGLAICKKIVELQAGEIKVSSELGRGSVFSFSIPYELCDEKALASKTPPITDLTILAGKHVLWADDNEMNILLAQTLLSKYKITIDIAYDGQEAFNLFVKNKYDLIFTDIQMPIMSGVDLSKAVRLHHDVHKCKIPILGVTANVLSDDCKLYMDAGMNDLVLKPFSEKELLEKIAIQINREK